MTTIDHLEIPMDRQKPWRVGASLVLVAFGIFSFSALLHFHVVHEGRGTVGSPFLAPVLGLSSALGFGGALCFSLLLTLWAGIAFVTDQWVEPLRRIWISMVFALCLAVFVHGLDYDGGALGGPIAIRMAHVLGDAFSTFLLGVLTLLAFLLATNWLFFENFLALARGRDADFESGLAELEAELLQAKDDAERGRLLRSMDAGPLVMPASPTAIEQDRLELEEMAGAVPDVAAPVQTQPLAQTSNAPASAAAAEGLAPTALHGKPRVGRAMPVADQGAATPSGPSASTLSTEDLAATSGRRDRIRSARLRRDQEVLEEILEEVRSSIGPEPTDVSEPAASDPMADLDDDLLLEKAGQALDELLGEGGGSLELNLPGAGQSESEVGRAEQPSADDDPANSPVTRDKIGDPVSSEPEARIQTAMGNIPIVDRDALARTGGEPIQEDLYGTPEDQAEPRIHEAESRTEEEALEEIIPDVSRFFSSGAAEADSDEVDLRELDALEGRTPDEAPVHAEASDVLSTEEEVPDNEDEDLNLPVTEIPQPEIQREESEVEITEPALESTETTEPPQVENLSEATSEVEAPRDHRSEDIEVPLHESGDEPVFILEPQPTVRIYHDRVEGETEGYTQEELFAADPPDPELLDRAARVLLTSRRPTVSLLQRRIGLSFAEARQIMMYMQQLGALAAPAGGGPWGALISLGEWDERRA